MPAWLCVFCESGNDETEPRCQNCGLSRKGGISAALSSSRRPPGLLRRAGAPATELAVATGLFALWKLGDVAAGAHAAGAVGRGRAVWAFERRVHLPSEAGLQQLVLGHADVVHALDVYYALAHIGGMAGVAVWTYARHRAAYARLRTTVAVTTAACFAIQLVPVAPPRLVPGLGMVDTASHYGESVYGHGRLANPVSSLPSVHLAWALIAGVAVFCLAPRGWRWLGLLHPALTLAAVVLTANHYWVDCLLAAALTGLVAVGVGRIRGP